MGQIFTYSNNHSYPEKYSKVRSEIENGDLILYRGRSFLAKSIMYFDKAFYNHIGVVWKPEDTNRICTLDMWNEGLDCVPLSRRMEGYRDFCILRPKIGEEKIKQVLSQILDEWDGRDIKYDTMLLLRIAFVKKTGIDITGLGKKNKFICSEFAQHYCEMLGLNTYSNINLITPEDFRRFIDDNFELIHDDGPSPDMSFYKKEICRPVGDNYCL